MGITEYSIVFLLAVITSFFGTSVGGAGLILIPALILLGLSPQEAVATSVLSYIGIAGSGWYAFHTKGKIDYKIVWPFTLLFIVGVVVGSVILLELNEDAIRKLIGIFILIFVIIALAARKSGLSKVATSPSRKMIGYSAIAPLGIHAGVMGGGTSTLVTYVLIYCFGQTYIQSAGTRKPMFLFRTLVSLFIYIPAGIIVFSVGIVQMIGMAIGSYFGAHYAIKKGNIWVRNIFLLVTIALAIKMLI